MSAQRGRLSANHPQAFARRLGLPIRGGTHVTWTGLLDFAVEAYWWRNVRYGVEDPRCPRVVVLLDEEKAA